MAHVAKLRAGAGALAIQQRIRVGRRSMRCVRALLAPKIDLGIAPARLVRRRLIGPSFVLRAEALHAGPRLDQGAVDREVVARQEPIYRWPRQDRSEELRCDVTIQQPVTVLRKARSVPHPIIDAEPDEPSERQVEIEPLHHLALGANAVKHLQQQRAQQLLRRDRGAADVGIDRLELTAECRQRFVHDLTDRSQWVTRGHPLLKVNIGKQLPRSNI